MLSTIILAIGIGLVGIGLSIHINLGVLCVYLTLGFFAGWLQFKRAGLLAGIPFIIVFLFFAQGSHGYEKLYLFGCLLMTWGIVMKLEKREESTELK